LPDVPTPAVIVDMNNSNHVYIGTDIGVFVSTDGGGNWQDFNDGLPDAVQGMDLNITYANNVIRVMTHGNGGYERKLLSQLPTGLELDPPVVSSFKLEQNYPNPFNPSTTISWQLPVDAFVSLKVYDILGNEVASLMNEEKPAGSYEVEFSAKGGSASGGDAWNLTSGVYFYQLRAGNFVETRKMILLK
jgi:hypothetical protein